MFGNLSRFAFINVGETQVSSVFIGTVYKGVTDGNWLLETIQFGPIYLLNDSLLLNGPIFIFYSNPLCR